YTNIWRWGNGVDWAYVTQLGPGATAFTDTGLNFNTNYQYILLHVEATTGIQSANSNQGSSNTLDHLRFIMDGGQLAGQSWDITANGMGFDASKGNHQGHFNRNGGCNWYGVA